MLISVSVMAQDRYMVFFTDKLGSGYSINSPLEFITQKSLDRRARSGKGVSEQDIPVVESYVDLVKNTGAEVYYRSRWMNGVLIQGTQEQIDLINAISVVHRVEWIGPGAPLQGGRIDRSNKLEQTEEESTAVQNNIIGTDSMLEDGYTGAGISIAVLDAGFPAVNSISAFSDLMLSSRIRDGWDYVGNSGDVFNRDAHGTWILSLLTASLEGEYQGVAPGADYYLYITEDVGSEHRVEEYNFLFAVERADSIGVDIITASLGYQDFDLPSPSYTISDLDGNTAIVSKVAKWAADRGMLFVSSAGNYGNNSWGRVTFPGDCDVCLVVGAVNSEGIRASYSSTGPTYDGRIKPDVMAMGSGIQLVSTQNQIVSKNGTSLSTPLIAGLAAGIWQAYPDYSVEDLINVIKQSADRASNPDNEYGYGIPNYLGIVNYLNDDILDTEIIVFPNPVQDSRIHIRVDNPSAFSQIDYSLISLSGQKVLAGSLEFNWVNPERILDLGKLQQGIYILKLENEEIQLNWRVMVR